MKIFTCVRCGVVQDVPSWIQRDSQIKPWPHRCTACGAVHSFLKGSCDVISPQLVPTTDKRTTRYSPWIAGNHHPVESGLYDTTWRDVDMHLQLTWNGKCWLHNGLRVRGVIVAFRGKWL